MQITGNIPQFQDSWETSLRSVNLGDLSSVKREVVLTVQENISKINTIFLYKVFSAISRDLKNNITYSKVNFNNLNVTCCYPSFSLIVAQKEIVYFRIIIQL